MTGYKEVRAGIALAYVELCKEMGSTFIEKHTGVFCQHILELAAHSGAAGYNRLIRSLSARFHIFSNSFDSVEMQYSRKCIGFVLRSVLGGMLSEQAQIAACKHLGVLLSRYNNSFGLSINNKPEMWF